MPKAISTNWLLLLVLIGSLAVVACAGGDEPAEVTFDLRIADRALVGFESSLEVKQDDLVAFNLTSDEAASFHLHGYDHELEIVPQVTGSVRFIATATGSFPITIHVGAESDGEGHDAITAGDGHHEKTIEAPADLSVGVDCKGGRSFRREPQDHHHRISPLPRKTPAASTCPAKATLTYTSTE